MNNTKKQLIEHLEFDDQHKLMILWENDEPFFKAREIAKILDIKNVSTSIKEFNGDEKVIRQLISPGGKQNTLMFTKKGVIRLLQKTRKEIPPSLLEYFSIKEHRFMPAETDFCLNIQTAFEDLEWIPQYPVGKYKIDLFNIEHLIALEFDESHHSNEQNRKKDIEREFDIKYISGYGDKMVFIRHGIKDNIFETINVIREHIDVSSRAKWKKEFLDKIDKIENMLSSLLKNKDESSIDIKVSQDSQESNEESESQELNEDSVKIERVDEENESDDDEEESEEKVKPKKKRIKVKGTGKCSECKVKINKYAVKCADCYKRVKKFEITHSKLNELVWVKKLPYTEIGRMYGVSDNAIRKRCKLLGIELRKR